METQDIIRKPAVAGMFYPSNPNELRRLLRSIASSEDEKVNPELATGELIGGIVPHAGYLYSGYEAYHFFELTNRKKIEYETIIIINPDHQGYCSEYAVSPADCWESPLGKIQVDKELASFFPQSEIAHRMEHSAEVMVPFIQEVLQNDCRILPICIGHSHPVTARKLAELIIYAVQTTMRKVLIIASSDFSHYVEPDLGVKLDNLALEKIFAFDAEGLNDVVRKNRLSVCGFAPIMTLIEYSKKVCSAPQAKILARGNSSKHSYSDSVVDYISIAITK